MKIITKKDESDKDFYDELLYVTTKYSKILVNPHIKMRKIISTYLINAILGLISFIILLILYLNNNKITLLILLILFGLILILTIIYFINALNFIRNELKESGGSVVDINKYGVRLTKGKKMDYKIGWSDIKYILINKHSITCIPSKRTFLMIGVNIIHKDDIIKAIKEEKKSSLIIDNSELYK